MEFVLRNLCKDCEVEDCKEQAISEFDGYCRRKKRLRIMPRMIMASAFLLMLSAKLMTSFTWPFSFTVILLVIFLASIAYIIKYGINTIKNFLAYKKRKKSERGRL